MTKNKLFAWAITLLCFSLTSCSDEKDGPSEKILVTNAGVTEANQTVKPGDIVHIYGDGFQEGDQVDFDFRWDLGEPFVPGRISWTCQCGDCREAFEWNEYPNALSQAGITC